MVCVYLFVFDEWPFWMTFLDEKGWFSSQTPSGRWLEQLEPQSGFADLQNVRIKVRATKPNATSNPALMADEEDMCLL
jgi:hypothetical protein